MMLVQILPCTKMQSSICVVLALAIIVAPGVCFPIVTPELVVTEQDHSGSTGEEPELKIVSVQHYVPQDNFPMAMSKKKPSLPSEDPTTKVPKAGDATIFCLNERSNDTRSTESMTLEDLKGMVNTVDQVFGTQPTHETYITLDYGERILSSYDPIQVYYRLFDMVDTNQLSKPSDIWMTQSPCFVCARRLIYEYGKPDSIKPTLRIASIYTGNSVLDTVDSLKCMAKMVHLNFTILQWEWSEVRDNLDHGDCTDSIDLALQHSSFNAKQAALQKLIEFVNELSVNPAVSSWCEVFA